MTTIAYDGKTLAVDSLITSDGTILGSSEKHIRLDDGRWMAYSGSMAYMPAVVKWLNGGEKPKFGENKSCMGIIVHPCGKAEEFSDLLQIFPSCIPVTVGSGWQIALTAMKCGKTATEAVKIACELDTYTGGKVHSVKIKRKKKVVK